MRKELNPHSTKDNVGGAVSPAYGELSSRSALTIIPPRAQLEPTCDTTVGFTAGEVGHVQEGVIEGGIDVANAKHGGLFASLGPVAHFLLFFLLSSLLRFRLAVTPTLPTIILKFIIIITSQNPGPQYPLHLIFHNSLKYPLSATTALRR